MVSPVLWRCHPGEAMDLAPLFSEPSMEEVATELYSCMYILVSCEKLNHRTLPALHYGWDRHSAACVQPAVSGITASLSSYCFVEAPCIHQQLK